MRTIDFPRVINPASAFEALVQFFYERLVTQQKAPGFLVGLSGTDSLVVFLAAYKALEKAGKGNRMMGVHFAPSEDFLYDHPEAEAHLWFRDQVLPWLIEQAPNAQIIVDTSIDWRCDGLRWGALMDMSVVSNDKRRAIRLPEDQYWVVGTRNRTEDVLRTYSNASMAASVQPIIHLWKSEILQISEYLGVPKIAIAKSCETDCICGRMRLAGQYVKEIDMLLMTRLYELYESYVDKNIPRELRDVLRKFISSQINKNDFKAYLPYSPNPTALTFNDPLVLSFEDGSLPLNEFNHYKHLYIAWFYLRTFPFEYSFERYCSYLQVLLQAAGQVQRFSLKITKAYFDRLYKAMHEYPTDNFDDLVAKTPEIILKITA